MMLDIDYFKKVNDEFGHSVGDQVLKQFVKEVHDFLEPYDIKMGRWGGEEFVCVCYNMDINQIHKIADELREKIAGVEFEKCGKLTCSVGLTDITAGDTAEIVFDRVDKSMYEAKTNGRNCVVIKKAGQN